MITAQRFYGGAAFTEFTGPVLLLILHANSARCQNVKTTSAGTVRLPPVDLMPLGAPLFVINNTGGNSIQVRSSSNDLLTTLAAGTTTHIGLSRKASGGWRFLSWTTNTPRTRHVESRSNPRDNPIVTPRTYSPDCVDSCSATVPLVSTRLPMWINSCIARNRFREAVRGADLLVPTILDFTIAGLFSKDAAHTHAPAISAELATALAARHQLTYYSVATSTAIAPIRSRHWHHIRLNELFDGSCTWSQPEYLGEPGIPVRRLVWRKLVPYTVGQTAHTLEVRFMAEHSWDADLEAPDKTQGLWGTSFTFWAFSTEINGSYVDGDPDPDQHDIPFTLDDPGVWGPAYGGTGGRYKFAHPRALLSACIPTTFQAPCGAAWVPPGEELRSYCYRKQSGAPWSLGSACDARDNTAFLGDLITAGRAAMTVGGDVPMSELYPFICIENGAGYGLTAMKPTNPGWDEEAGDLAIGSDISLTDCATDQTEAKVDPCYGHPSDPFDLVGGTHRCFKTNGLADDTSAKFCCVNISQSATVVTTQICTVTAVSCGSDDGFGGCIVKSAECSIARTYTTTLDMEVADYSLSPTAVSSRFIRFWSGSGDPDYQPFNHDHPVFPAALATARGTWVKSSGDTIVNCVLATDPGILAPWAYFEFAPVGFSATHGVIQAHVDINTVSESPLGLGVKMRPAATSYDGYGGIYFPQLDRLRIIKWRGGVRTILAETNFTWSTQRYMLRFSFRGATMTLGIYSDDETTKLAECVGYDCEFASGGTVGFVGEEDVAGAEYSAFKYTDENAIGNPGADSGHQIISFAELVTALAPTLTVSIDQKMTGAYLDDDCTSLNAAIPPGGCSDSANCGSSYLEYNLHQNLAGSSNLINVSSLGDGNPFAELCKQVADCGGGPIPACGDCPGPFLAVRVSLPGGCGTVPPENRLSICGGMEVWQVVYVACT